MTKTKKQSVAIVLLSVVVAMLVAFGATYAWFTATETTSSTGSAGTLTLTLTDGAGLTAVANNSKIVPNVDIVATGATIATLQKDAGDIDTYVRVLFTAIVSDDKNAESLDMDNVSLSGFVGSGVEGDNYLYYATDATTITEWASTALSLTTSGAIVLDPAVYGNDYLGKYITISITVETIQADGNVTSVESLADYFPAIDYNTGVQTISQT